MSNNNNSNEMYIALTAAKQLEHNMTLKKAWEEAKQKTKEGMTKEGVVDNELGTMFRSYITFTESLAYYLLKHLEDRKLIVVSTERRDEVINLMSHSPMIMGAAEFALGEMVKMAKDDIISKEKNNG